MKEKRTTDSFIDFIGYALYAFGGLGFELLWMAAETALYGHAYEMWSDTEHTIHWGVTCIVWGTLALILKKKLPSSPTLLIQAKQFIIGSAVFIVSVMYTSFVWNGWKPMIEFSDLGPGKFIVQYIYYAFESLLIILIIIYGQHAFETRIRRASSVPFGGLLLAATWGLVHILTQGYATGIYTIIQSVLYGSIFLILKKNYVASYIAVTLMFML